MVGLWPPLLGRKRWGIFKRCLVQCCCGRSVLLSPFCAPCTCSPAAVFNKDIFRQRTMCCNGKRQMFRSFLRPEQCHVAQCSGDSAAAAAAAAATAGGDSAAAAAAAAAASGNNAGYWGRHLMQWGNWGGNDNHGEYALTHSSDVCVCLSQSSCSSIGCSSEVLFLHCKVRVTVLLLFH